VLVSVRLQWPWSWHHARHFVYKYSETCV
jgi:hypothetical protein